MKLHVERRHIEPLMRSFPRLESFRDQLRFGNRVEIPFNHLEGAELDMLQALYGQGDQELRAQAAQIATLRSALASGGRRFEAEELEMAVPAIARYLSEGASRGWMFSADITGKPLAYVVTRLDFTPPSEEETGKIFLELKANAKAAGDGDPAHFRAGHRRAHDSGNPGGQGLRQGNAGTVEKLRRGRRALFRMAGTVRRAVLRLWGRLFRREPDGDTPRHRLFAQGCHHPVVDRQPGAPVRDDRLRSGRRRFFASKIS